MVDDRYALVVGESPAMQRLVETLRTAAERATCASTRATELLGMRQLNLSRLLKPLGVC